MMKNLYDKLVVIDKGKIYKIKYKVNLLPEIGKHAIEHEHHSDFVN